MTAIYEQFHDYHERVMSKQNSNVSGENFPTTQKKIGGKITFLYIERNQMSC